MRKSNPYKKALDEQMKEQKRAMKEYDKTLNVWLKVSKREPVPADIKKEVIKRVMDKYHKLVCQKCHEKERGVTLEFHHIDFNRNHNKASNIELLCPNHHCQRHNLKKKK
jgi:hypothetical protein